MTDNQNIEFQNDIDEETVFNVDQTHLVNTQSAVAPKLTMFILPVQLSSFSAELHPPVPEMNASSPKPKTSSIESGKKFCACSHVPETVSPPVLDHKHLMCCMALAKTWASWKMTYCMMFMFAPQTNPHTHLCIHTTNAPTGKYYTFFLLHFMMYQV